MSTNDYQYNPVAEAFGLVEDTCDSDDSDDGDYTMETNVDGVEVSISGPDPMCVYGMFNKMVEDHSEGP